MIDTLVARTTKLASQSHSRRRLATRSLLLQRQSFNIITRTSSSFTLFDSLSNSYKSVPLSITPNNQSLESKIHNSDAININSDNDMKDKDPPPRRPKGLAWYTCGPTVYDSAHLGHARTYVSLDILQRSLLHLHKLQSQSTPMPHHIDNASSNANDNARTKVNNNNIADNNANHDHIPPPPIFIMNITDVDDKILARSKERNVPALELAQTYEREFWQDMQALNVMRPTIITRVTDHVESSIIPYIEKIEKSGIAYRLDDGVYFDVTKFEEKSGSGRTNRYGKMAPGRDETLFSWNNDENSSDEGNERRNRKKDPRDFVLWKKKKDADEELTWDSPFGVGRPGWHIECSAMIDSTMQLDSLRDRYRIYVHAGGVDLKFPHHTNEIAQAEAYMLATNEEKGVGSVNTEEEWIPHWIHTGHLHIDGLKMSKSLKNFITIRDVLKTNKEEALSSTLDSPADDFRLWCLGLSGSYRGPATYSKSRLEEARVTRIKILRFLVDGEQWVKGIKSNNEIITSTWCSEENDLIEESTHCHGACHKALLGLSGRDDIRSFDFDGAAYLSAMIDLSEAGSKYISGIQSSSRTPPIYAVMQALTMIRECLSIVGFSDNTARAGLIEKSNETILGGNEALVEELVEFRNTIRNASLAEVKEGGSGNSTEFAKNLLHLCDNVRDESLPAIGLEIYDGNVFPKWRFAVPRHKSTKAVKPVQEVKTDVKITMSNFFQKGRYANEFSAFDEENFPTENADGTEISKRMIKKLRKKRSSYFKN